MNRQSYLKLIVGLSLVLGSVVRADDVTALQAKADKSIANAEQVVANVRAELDGYKKILATVPKQTSEYQEIKQYVAKATVAWKKTIVALDSSKKFANRISKVSSPDLANKFALLAVGSANVAQAGAESVEMCLYFVEAVATKNRTGVAIIRGTIVSSFDNIAQAEGCYKRVKKLIAEGK